MRKRVFKVGEKVVLIDIKPKASTLSTSWLTIDKIVLEKVYTVCQSNWAGLKLKEGAVGLWHYHEQFTKAPKDVVVWIQS